MADARKRMKGLHQWEDAVVREAIQQAKGPLYVASADETKLDHTATMAFRLVGPDLARLGFEIANAVDAACPASARPAREHARLRAHHRRDLVNAERPLVVAGYSTGDESLLHAAANVAWALKRKGRPARLCFTVPECNSLGAAMLPGGSIDDALAAVRAGQRRCRGDRRERPVPPLQRRRGRRAARQAPHVIAIDSLTNGTTARADVVLPAATFAEADGTLVNNEGRAQRFFQTFVPDGDGPRELAVDRRADRRARHGRRHRRQPCTKPVRRAG